MTARRNRISLPHAERIKRSVTIDPDNGCWLWNLTIDHRGYGQMTVGRTREGTNRRARAHRVSYEAFVGPIPDGLDIDHLCRVRRCVNPAHLDPVTRGENLLRGDTITAQHAAKGTCPKCGGPYTTRSRSNRKGVERVCVPCKAAYRKAYRERTGK